MKIRRRFTLRTKLVALLVGLFTLAFLLVAVVTSLELRGFLLDQLDQQLHDAGTRYAVSLEHGGDHDNDREQLEGTRGQPAGTLGARVVNGRVTAAAVVRGTPPSAAARRRIARLTVDRSPHSVDLPGLGGYRVLVTRGLDGDLLVTGLPLEGVEHTVRRLLAIEAVVFGGALLLVGVSGAIFVRLALRPLNRVAETAARVSDLPLSSGTVSMPERAPAPDTHTEVGTLSSAFNHMLAHVEASLHRRQASEDRLRRFIADASHELRTPVSVVRGHAELALRTGGDLPEEVQRSLERITAESQRMGHLVDDLLLLARIDSGRPLARDEVDVTRLVIDAVSDAQVAGPDHKWRLDVPAEPVLACGDDHALHQVLANLLANARVHTPAGTEVLAAARSLDDGSAEITVSDNGPGIPADVLPHIFERFVRADSARSTTTGSSGLGLGIVDAIVRGHGGTTQLTSEPGGTRVRIVLPPPPPTAGGPSQGSRALQAQDGFGDD